MRRSTTSTTFTMSLFLVWFAFAFIVGIFASSRGRSGFGWFLLAAIFSPLLAFIVCAVMENLRDTQAKQASIENLPSEKTHVRCAQCAEFVLPQAKVCKHCGSALTPVTQPASSIAQPSPGVADDNSNEALFMILPWIGVGAVGLIVWWFSK
jgi:uncharacterized membrane protein YhdT